MMKLFCRQLKYMVWQTDDTDIKPRPTKWFRNYLEHIFNNKIEWIFIDVYNHINALTKLV